MGSNSVFRTLQAKLSAFAVMAAICAVAFAPAAATTFVPSQTYKAGTKINTTLDEAFNSTTAKYGDKFKLKVVDPSHPALVGSEVVGWITEVDQPSGVNRAKVGFFITSIHLPNGTKKPIVAYVVSRRVTQMNPAGQSAARQQMMQAGTVPNGFVTPGPIAWQARVGGGNGGVSVSNRPSTSVGGYIYAQSAHEPIVVPQGQPVTIELQQDLTIP
jgi:hypothetical protein